VVALKPDLKQVVEAPIVSDIFGGKMAMIIKDRLPRRVLTKQVSGCFGFK
jgi:hypothetical protein